MPFSLPHAITPIVAKMITVYKEINSVLDLGCGFGKYGVLCRETFDIFAGRYKLESWRTRIVGVEIYPEYITSFQKTIYSEIIIKDALTYLKETKEKFDMILCLDVIEHLPKEQGKELVKEILAHHNKLVFITTPNGYMPQGALYNNEHETHRCGWTVEEFKELGLDTKIIKADGMVEELILAVKEVKKVRLAQSFGWAYLEKGEELKCSGHDGDEQYPIKVEQKCVACKRIVGRWMTCGCPDNRVLCKECYDKGVRLK